jgi:L-ascorbate metabolism protein UlaG (beta-lactamase superfamily)
MRIQKFLHSCLLIEKGSDRILFDPGKFSFVEHGARAVDFTRLNAVIITHSHPDHMDDDALKLIIEKNPGAVLYGNSGIASALQPKGLKVELFDEGTKQIGDFRVDAYEARHEKIVAAKIPRTRLTS